MSNEGKNVKVHYTGTLDDGTKFDSSYDHGQPLAFTCMAGQMIPGFDEAVKDMAVGETKTVVIAAKDAYGEYNENMVQTFKLNQMPGAEHLVAGMTVQLATQQGYPIQAKVAARDEDTITFDMNHELAGKDLTFEITLLEVEE